MQAHEKWPVTQVCKADNIVRITPKWYNIGVIGWEGVQDGTEKSGCYFRAKTNKI